MPFEGVDVLQVLEAGMKVSSMNHRLIANNIANVDTPNYNPVRLDFQATLKSVLDGRSRLSLRKTHPRHIDAGVDLAQFERLAISSKNDYNKVDLDEEMARLSENTGRYTTYGSLVVKRFRGMKDMLNNIR